MNTKARGVRHNSGGEYRFSRNSKGETFEQVKGSMHSKLRRGLDYTPLFKFLLSKVGSKWDDVFSEAKSRLDRTDPIFWLVALDEISRKEVVCMGETSFYSGLFVDTEGILQLVNPDLKTEDLMHYCTCCTHTFNGKPY